MYLSIQLFPGIHISFQFPPACHNHYLDISNGIVYLHYKEWYRRSDKHVSKYRGTAEMLKLRKILVYPTIIKLNWNIEINGLSNSFFFFPLALYKRTSFVYTVYSYIYEKCLISSFQNLLLNPDQQHCEWRVLHTDVSMHTIVCVQSIIPVV